MSNNLFSTTLRIFSVAGAAVFLSFSPAQAILIDNGSMTLDTGTGLKWLHLTESINRSFDDVSRQFGAGGDFAGRRHANFAKVFTLFVNAGLPDGHDVSPASPDMSQQSSCSGRRCRTSPAMSSRLVHSVASTIPGPAWIKRYSGWPGCC